MKLFFITLVASAVGSGLIDTNTPPIPSASPIIPVFGTNLVRLGWDPVPSAVQYQVLASFSTNGTRCTFVQRNVGLSTWCDLTNVCLNLTNEFQLLVKNGIGDYSISEPLCFMVEATCSARIVSNVLVRLPVEFSSDLVNWRVVTNLTFPHCILNSRWGFLRAGRIAISADP